MFKGIFGSDKRGKILLYLYTRGESYPREISRNLNIYLNGVQNQLLNLEKENVLYSKLRGKIRLFGINPRYPFKKELDALLEKFLLFMPEEEKTKYYMPRLRPRRTNKPL